MSQKLTEGFPEGFLEGFPEGFLEGFPEGFSEGIPEGFSEDEPAQRAAQCFLVAELSPGGDGAHRLGRTRS